MRDTLREVALKSKFRWQRRVRCNDRLCRVYMYARAPVMRIATQVAEHAALNYHGLQLQHQDYGVRISSVPVLWIR